MVRFAVHKVIPRCQGFLNLLLPPSCAVCDADLENGNFSNTDLNDRAVVSTICVACAENLALLPKVCCRRCGAGISPRAAENDHCSNCSKPKLRFSSLTYLGRHHGALRDVVLRMKQASQITLTLTMGALLARDRRAALEQMRPDLLVPIPMHWNRRLFRGVNSAEILAESISQALSVRVARGILRMCRNPLIQSSLSPSRRFENMRGAFRCSPGYDITGARVLLVDDVLTTGATCSEAAAQLRKHGAEDVFVAVVSRAERTA